MKKIGLLSIFVCLLINTAFAVRVTTLYQGVVPVASQSPTEREHVLQQALGQVFIKVSGNTQILSNPTIKSHLGSASTLMQEFSYTPSSEQAKPYLLHLNFDPDSIN